MLHLFHSLKAKACLAAAALFAAGLAIAGAAAFFAMNAVSERPHAEQMSASINAAMPREFSCPGDV